MTSPFIKGHKLKNLNMNYLDKNALDVDMKYV